MQACEEDTTHDLLMLYNDLHFDNLPNSDNELPSYRTYEYAENECEHLTTLHSFLEEVEDNDQDKTTSEFKNILRNWTVKHAVKNSAVSDLLFYLKSHPCFSTLPKDARTLLHTPRKCNIIDIEPGQYCHFGLINDIMYTILYTNMYICIRYICIRMII